MPSRVSLGSEVIAASGWKRSTNAASAAPSTSSSQTLPTSATVPPAAVDLVGDRRQPERTGRDRRGLVADAEAVETAVDDLPTERINGPALFGVERDRVDMPVDQQLRTGAVPDDPDRVAGRVDLGVIEAERLHPGYGQADRGLLISRHAGRHGKRAGELEQGRLVDRRHRYTVHRQCFGPMKCGLPREIGGSWCQVVSRSRLRSAGSVLLISELNAAWTCGSSR